MANSIDNLPSGSEEAASIVSQLALRMIERVAQSDKPLSDLILAAAIPHRFNRQILDALQLVNDTRTSIDGTIRRIKRLSFVKEVNQDLFSYHEEVRSALLQFWHSPPQLQKYVAYSDGLRIYFAEKEDINEMLYHWIVVDSDLAFIGLRYRLELLLENYNTVDVEALARLAREQDRFLNDQQRIFLELTEAELKIMRFQWEEAAQDFERISENPSGSELDRSRALLGLGSCLNHLGNWVQALAVLKQAAEILKEQTSDKLTYVLLALGWSYFRLKKTDQAIEVFKDALSLAQTVRNFQAQGSALGNLGTVYQNMKSWKDALYYHQRALQIRREIEPEGFFVGRSLQSLADTYLKLEDYERSFPLATSALEIQQKVDDQFGQSFTLHILATHHENSANYVEARKLLEEAWDIRRQLGAKKEIADTLSRLARVCEQQNMVDEAAQYLSQANEMKDKLKQQVSNAD